MASKKITELTTGSLTPPLSGTTAVVYSGTTHQQDLLTLRQTLVDSGSHNFTGSNVFVGNQTISGSIYLDGDSIDNGILIGTSGTYIGTAEGSIYLRDSNGYAQIDIFGESYSVLRINANNQNFFQIEDDTIGSSLEFTKSGSLLINEVSYDAHLATTSSNVFLGDQIVTGSVKQHIDAESTNSIEFIHVKNATIDGIDYEVVNSSFKNYPLFGDFYQNTFIIEYFNSSSYDYGTEFTLNGKNINSSVYASGSESIGRISVRDMHDGTTFANMYADNVEIGAYSASTTIGITIGHNDVPYVNISSLQNNINGNVTLTGSLNVSGFTILSEVSSSLNFVDDAEAASNGVPLGGLYRSGSFVLIRLV